MRRVEGLEVVAADSKSFTGQYLRPLLERASVQPDVVDSTKRSRKPALSHAEALEAGEPNLLPAK